MHASHVPSMSLVLANHFSGYHFLSCQEHALHSSGGVYMLFLLLYYLPHFISFFRPIPTSSRKPFWVSLHLQTIKVFYTCFSILVAHQLQERPSALTSDGLLVQIPAACVQGMQPPSGQVQADTRLGSECVSLSRPWRGLQDCGCTGLELALSGSEHEGVFQELWTARVTVSCI